VTARKGKKQRNTKRWVRNVTTDSTHPSAGLFTKEPATIAKELASEKVSPKGIGSAIRMVQYFINRGGKGLSTERRRKLETAKRILQAKNKPRKESRSG
jgi:Protein of unknown function (DUF3175)